MFTSRISFFLFLILNAGCQKASLTKTSGAIPGQIPIQLPSKLGVTIQIGRPNPYIGAIRTYTTEGLGFFVAKNKVVLPGEIGLKLQDSDSDYSLTVSIGRGVDGSDSRVVFPASAVQMVTDNAFVSNMLMMYDAAVLTIDDPQYYASDDEILAFSVNGIQAGQQFTRVTVADSSKGSTKYVDKGEVLAVSGSGGYGAAATDPNIPMVNLYGGNAAFASVQPFDPDTQGSVDASEALTDTDGSKYPNAGDLVLVEEHGTTKVAAFGAARQTDSAGVHFEGADFNWAVLVNPHNELLAVELMRKGVTVNAVTYSSAGVPLTSYDTSAVPSASEHAAPQVADPSVNTGKASTDGGQGSGQGAPGSDDGKGTADHGG